MARCEECGAEVGEGATLCPECGVVLESATLVRIDSVAPGKKTAVKGIDHRGNEMLEVFKPEEMEVS